MTSSLSGLKKEIISYGFKGLCNPLNNNDKNQVGTFLGQLFTQQKSNLNPRTKYLFFRAGIALRENCIVTAYDILCILCDCPRACCGNYLENANYSIPEIFYKEEPDGFSTEKLQKWLENSASENIQPNKHPIK